MNIKNPKRKVSKQSLHHFLRKCHLPLHKGGESCMCHRTGAPRRSPTELAVSVWLFVKKIFQQILHHYYLNFQSEFFSTFICWKTSRILKISFTLKVKFTNYNFSTPCWKICVKPLFFNTLRIIFPHFETLKKGGNGWIPLSQDFS